jgi:hypothetical protein
MINFPFSKIVLPVPFIEEGLNLMTEMHFLSKKNNVFLT